MKSTRLALVLFIGTLNFTLCLSAQAEDSSVALSKKIMDSQCDASIYPVLEEAASPYFKDHKYNEYSEYINSLLKQKKDACPVLNYNAALARFNQLKYLEESQGWDEYFAQGNDYRDQIVSNLAKAIEGTPAGDTLNIRSRLLLWQFHRDQQDVFNEEALNDLIAGVTEYAKSAQDTALIKEVADKIAAYGEKGRSKEIYRIYVEKLTGADVKPEDLKQAALNFYKEGNLDLSESVFDAYIDKLLNSPEKERSVPEFLEIAALFSYKDTGNKDMPYAEKIFALIESVGGKEALGEEQIYLRAFNLEKSKDWPGAKDAYAELIERYPESKYAQRATFKLGVIYTYILRDKDGGSNYFVKLAEKDNISPEGISSLYQLGLLNQWQGESAKAKAYYSKLIEKAQGKFSETQSLTNSRLKEIEEGKPLDSKLQVFLDNSLKEENSQFNMSRASLSLNPYSANMGSEVAVNSSAISGASGCMQVELQYLWSGDLGGSSPQSAQANFNTSYKDPGTKVINLLVLVPSGTLDRALDFVDIE